MIEQGSEGTGRETATDETSATPDPAAEAAARPAGPTFAHASEAEMARILDFYAVRWEYEPHRFPILWNLDGTVVESFSPDFYLPDLDIYLEMTTLRQRLVRKKNRKLRRLRELYPDVRIKLFYARDFRALMLKYGKLALVDALSGTPGQVAPVGDEADLAVERLPGPASVAEPEPEASNLTRPGVVEAVATPPAARGGGEASGRGRRRPRRPSRAEPPGGRR